jgi:3D-(3,5/4)-trihydroxycyclohexane-1,2-dione acylhydrolase (decyclizing)
VIYSAATTMIKSFVEQTGIPVCETFAGKGSLPYNHPLNLGAVGVTGTPGANKLTGEADLVIGVGTRYSDFTTASKSAFQHPDVRFINVNVLDFDAFKHGAHALVGDARECLSELSALLQGYQTDKHLQEDAASWNASWDQIVAETFRVGGQTPVRQAEVIGAVSGIAAPQDMVLCAAGSLPGDLHKLWRTTDPKGFHLEYGYSTMGYEVAAGIGAKLASPDREIWVMVGDGNYLMMNNEIITAIQEGIKYTIVLLNNNGFGSIGSLSESVGSGRFGTRYCYRNQETGDLSGARLPVDFAQNARSLGAEVLETSNIESLKQALQKARNNRKLTVIVIETDLYQGVSGYAWWEVPVAEVSKSAAVRKAREDYENNKKNQRYYF